MKCNLLTVCHILYFLFRCENCYQCVLEKLAIAKLATVELANAKLANTTFAKAKLPNTKLTQDNKACKITVWGSRSGVIHYFFINE